MRRYHLTSPCHSFIENATNTVENNYIKIEHIKEQFNENIAAQKFAMEAKLWKIFPPISQEGKQHTNSKEMRAQSKHKQLTNTILAQKFTMGTRLVPENNPPVSCEGNQHNRK